jgi:hypothetical protein
MRWGVALTLLVWVVISVVAQTEPYPTQLPLCTADVDGISVSELTVELQLLSYFTVVQLGDAGDVRVIRAPLLAPDHGLIVFAVRAAP